MESLNKILFKQITLFINQKHEIKNIKNNNTIENKNKD